MRSGRKEAQQMLFRSGDDETRGLDLKGQRDLHLAHLFFAGDSIPFLYTMF